MRASHVACSSLVNSSNSYGIEWQYLVSSCFRDSHFVHLSAVADGRVKNVSLPGTRDNSKESLAPGPLSPMSSQRWDSRSEASRGRFQASSFHSRVELRPTSFPSQLET